MDSCRSGWTKQLLLPLALQACDHRKLPATQLQNSRLPILLASPNKIIVNRCFFLMRLLALFWLAVGMSVPVSAWAVHSSSHSVAQVDVDAHHHHDDNGGISVHEHEDNEAPDGGHDHIPSILLGAVTVPDVGTLPSRPLVAQQMFVISLSHGSERRLPHGLRRPPRLG